MEYLIGIFWRFIFWAKHRAGFLDLGSDIMVTGVVQWTDYGKNPDGDCTFNLLPDAGSEWVNTTFGGRRTTENPDYPNTIHCEIAPWQRMSPEVTARLRPGVRVRVMGRWGFDGVHTGKGTFVDVLYAIFGHGPDMINGWCEIHPVKSLDILT
jgi:hypothetical protein